MFLARAWEFLRFVARLPRPPIKLPEVGMRLVRSLCCLFLRPPKLYWEWKCCVYISLSRNWLDGPRLLSMALEGGYPHVLLQTSRYKMAAEAWAHRVAKSDRRSWPWITAPFFPASGDMPFVHCAEDGSCSPVFVNVACSAAEDRSIYDGLWGIAISIVWDHWDSICRQPAYTREIALYERFHV